MLNSGGWSSFYRLQVKSTCVYINSEFGSHSEASSDHGFHPNAEDKYFLDIRFTHTKYSTLVAGAQGYLRWWHEKKNNVKIFGSLSDILNCNYLKHLMSNIYFYVRIEVLHIFMLLFQHYSHIF